MFKKKGGGEKKTKSLTKHCELKNLQKCHCVVGLELSSTAGHGTWP